MNSMYNSGHLTGMQNKTAFIKKIYQTLHDKGEDLDL
jgi:hypothetical protein